MLKILLRTLIIYVMLVLIMRIMGKRQLGELELSELVTTILFSEIATTPITNPESNIWHAILPILTIAILEILFSFLLLKIPILKKMLTSQPSVIINRGIINKKEMWRSRITLDELVSQIRQSGVYSIDEVDYAILEENGRMTIVPKSKNRSPDAHALGVDVKDSGIMHIIISDGKINERNLNTLRRDKSWVYKYLRKHDLSPDKIFLMTLDDGGNIFIQSADGKIFTSKD